MYIYVLRGIILVKNQLQVSSHEIDQIIGGLQFKCVLFESIMLKVAELVFLEQICENSKHYKTDKSDEP